MEKLQIINSNEFGIEETKALTIEQSFLPKKVEFDGYLSVYDEIIKSDIEDSSTSKKARELRLKLVKVRTGIKDIHTTEKAFFLASGKYVDAIKNKLTLPVEQMEEKLIEIEKYQENKEKERKAQLKIERVNLLLPYEVDTTFIDLENMSEDQFDSFFDTNKTAYEAKKEAERLAELKRIEEEKKAEQERLKIQKEQEEERKRIEAENAKLKAEQEKQRQEIEKQRLEAEKLKAEQEKQLATEREKQRLINEAKEKELALEREKALKIQKELEEKQRIEAEQKAKIEAEQRQKELAPDKEKINALYLLIKNFEFPEVQDQDSKKIVESVKKSFDDILKNIVIEAKKLK